MGYIDRLCYTSSMVVGTIQVWLAVGPTESLKEKRSIVRRICGRVRNQFRNSAIAETGLLDDHNQAELGIAVVSNDARHCQSVMDKILSFIDADGSAPIADSQCELIHL